MITLGFSPCPNDTFVFDGWVHGRVPGAPEVEVTYADIDVLNSLAEEGSLDVVKVSYGALPWLLDAYQLLPCGGALGRGCGPLVLTRPGGEWSAGMRVAVPGLRTTAYLLMQLWSPAPVEVVVLPFDQIMPALVRGEVDAGLVIHESRFTYPGYGLEALADLGDWWESTTGHPIPLGAILARRELDPDALSAVIRTSLQQAWDDPSVSRPYVLEHSQELEPAVVDAHIGLYVNEFTLDLGETGLVAVRDLLSRAAAARLVPEVRL